MKPIEITEYVENDRIFNFISSSKIFEKSFEKIIGPSFKYNIGFPKIHIKLKLDDMQEGVDNKCRALIPCEKPNVKQDTCR